MNEIKNKKTGDLTDIKPEQTNSLTISVLKELQKIKDIEHLNRQLRRRKNIPQD